MARYRFIHNDNKVICISTFAKKSVKGVAKCSPSDDFNLETGKKLAQLRCDLKVADKRANRAAEKYVDAEDELYIATAHFNEMHDYFYNAELEYEKALNNLEAFEKELKKSKT